MSTTFEPQAPAPRPVLRWAMEAATLIGNHPLLYGALALALLLLDFGVRWVCNTYDPRQPEQLNYLFMPVGAILVMVAAFSVARIADRGLAAAMFNGWGAVTTAVGRLAIIAGAILVVEVCFIRIVKVAMPVLYQALLGADTGAVGAGSFILLCILGMTLTVFGGGCFFFPCLLYATPEIRPSALLSWRGTAKLPFFDKELLLYIIPWVVPPSFGRLDVALPNIIYLLLYSTMLYCGYREMYDPKPRFVPSVAATSSPTG